MGYLMVKKTTFIITKNNSTQLMKSKPIPKSNIYHTVYLRSLEKFSSFISLSKEEARCMNLV